MRRREFINLLAGLTAAWPLAARAQQRSRIPRVGIIDDAPIWNYFRQSLRDLRYVEGQTIAFEYRIAQGEPARLAEATADFARLPVDAIATSSVRDESFASRSRSAIRCGSVSWPVSPGRAAM